MNPSKETKWIQGVLLHPDDYTIAEQDEQRHQLVKQLRHEKLLDIPTQSVLEGAEALDEGWARPIVWGYREGFIGVSDAAAEIGALVDHPICRLDGD